MAGIRNSLSWLKGTAASRPTSLQSLPESTPSLKRKNSEADSQRPKSRKHSVTHARPRNVEHEGADFYEGHARDVHRASRSDYTTNLDRVAQASTDPSNPIKSQRGKGTVRHAGQSVIPTPEIDSDPELLRASSSIDDTVDRVWTENPIKITRALFEKSGRNKGASKKAIADSMRGSFGRSEPQYAFRDAEIRDSLWQIMDKLERFAKKYYEWPDDAAIDRNALKKDLARLAPETAKIIACVASGGPSGVDGWLDLFLQDQKRRALVIAIVGNVISEQVYQHLFFGGSQEDMTMLDSIQRLHQSKDSFYRNRLYADYVGRALKLRAGVELILPDGFHAHVLRIVAALEEHLSIPFLEPKTDVQDERVERAKDLYAIIASAGVISLLMRSDPHTVYYHVPTFKEDEFKRDDMECFNRKNMEVANPLERKTWPAGTSEEERRRARGDVGLTQIILLDGITAYRKGGRETAKSTSLKPEYEKGMAEKGIRSRILSHSWVYCRWGRQRRFVQGVERQGGKKVHGDAWKEPGFVEFRDVAEV